MDEPKGERERSPVLTGPVGRAVMVLALPVLVEQLLSFSVGMVDTYLASMSTNATTAVGSAAYVGWLASLIISFVGTGTTALVARHWGAGEHDAANRIANRSMAMAACMGLLVFVFVFVAAPGFAMLQQMEGETYDIVVRYLRLDGLGMIFASITLVGSAALRGAGNMRTPMKILGIVNVLNVIVSATLVYGLGPIPAMGIDGIVIGTVVARTSGGLLMIWVLFRGNSGLQLHRHEIHLKGLEVTRIMRIGLPAASEGIIMWAGNLLFLMIISRLSFEGFSKPFYAAHIIGIRVEALTYLPAVAWGHAAATMIGQALGAGDAQRARRAGQMAVLQCSLLAVGLMAFYYFGAEWIYTLMTKDDAVRAIGIPAFQFMALFQVPLVLSIVYVLALHGAGETRYPLIFTIIGVLFIRVPLGYVCGIVLHGGLIGAWIGMNVDVTVRAILLFIRFRWGDWQGTRV
ncbi:Multidrug resistance protein NorM [Symmachiella macrocystis]|uniref:Multidrug-efflux transporter n=1 Tax=Symmachiella macrocystis TaxID=2527985 RepID=A0A5C6BSB6_9PLAN|nr:MATE family efflux transporter [Symmachiella macrocystis]TWU13584.1 Multidrug resistance protein NorM [Symmachiella macrocystis]